MKKIACLLLCGALLAGAALAEGGGSPIPLSFRDGAALVDGSGREIVPRGTYDAFIPLNNAAGADALFAAGQDVDGELRFALLDGAGAALTEPLYELLSLADDLVVCSRDGLLGALDQTGRELIAPAYTSLVPNGAGGVLALKTDCWDDQPDGVYCVDAAGGESATGVKTLFMFDSWFSEGRLALLSAENNRYGYVDAQGQWTVRPQFTYAAEYADGLAVAAISSGYGVIDRDGNWALTPRYSLIWRCEDLFLATEGSSTCVGFDSATLAEKFRIEGENIYAYDDGDCIVVSDDAHTRLYDMAGALLYTAPALASLSGTEGGHIIVEDGPWGSERAALMAADGTQLGAARQSIFSLGLVDGAERFGYMTMDAEPDAQGGEYWDYDPYSTRYGLLDADGAELTGAVFTELSRADGTCLIASTEDETGLIDGQGEWIVKWADAP